MTSKTDLAGIIDAAIKPLPCPFCGEEPSVSAHGFAIFVQCDTVDCPASSVSTFGALDQPGDEVIARWNRRA